MANLIYLPNIPIQYKINNAALKSSVYTDQNGQFSIQLYEGDILTLYIYDNDNNYIPILINPTQISSATVIDINLLKKQIQNKNTINKRPTSN